MENFLTDTDKEIKAIKKEVEKLGVKAIECSVWKDGGLGAEENVSYEISMYPNPTYDKVTIQGKDLNSIEIYNALSVIVYREKEITNNVVVVNTDDFSRGLYFVKYTLSDGTTGIMRLVVE